ncbi:MAG: AMP-binding protein [Sphingobium sp.]
MTFIRIGDRNRETKEILDAGARAATGLEQAGIGKGDVIALLLRNDYAFLEASLAAGQIGAYATPVNWHNAPAEVRYVLEDSGARLLVAHADLLARVAGEIPAGVTVLAVPTPADLCAIYGVESPPLPAGVEDWDQWVARHATRTAEPLPSPGAMFYTSGTTGRPKGVRRAQPTPDLAAHSLEMFLALTGMRDWMDRPHEAVALIAGPLYHGTPNGWTQALVPMGVNLVIEQRFDAEALLEHIQRYRVTHALLVPTMFVRMLKLPPEVRAKYDLSSLQFIMHGGAPCPPAVKQAMIDWLGPIIAEHYGSTEVGVITVADSPQWLSHPGTVGKPLPAVRIEILDEAGEPLPANQSGDIYCKNFGYVDFTYHGDDEKRKRAEKRGLVSLGDVGFLDDDGFLHLSGRSSEIIVSGGTNIYPAEIEGELLKLAGVADCAVFGIPNEEFGEEVCAYVQPQPGATLDPAVIRSSLRETIAGYKVPRTIAFIEALPREDSGKVFKKRLRDPYWAR